MSRYGSRESGPNINKGNANIMKIKAERVS